MSNYNYKKVASDYDNLLQQHKWQAPELLYKYLSKFIQKDTKLLDIGVGTGISSQRFHNRQVVLYGLDNSSDMLAICEAKGIFKEVLLFDILKDEIPYPEATFDYVICSGVFHFFSSLEEIFAKISRVIKCDGFFAFTIIENYKNDQPYTTEIINGVNLYQHSKDYLSSLTNQFNFINLYEQTFTTVRDLNTKELLDHTLIILRKE
jgi:predicted TPR repeat methyltransferase